MRKPAVDHHKAYMSPYGRSGAPAVACGRQRSPRVPRTEAAPAAWTAACPVARPAVGLAFATVRPGFFAACIVEAVAGAGGGSATASAGTVPAVGQDDRPRRGDCRAGAAGAPSGRPRWRGGGSRHNGRGLPRQGRRNGQMEHFFRLSTRPRKGVGRSAAITPRERADARDLLLTTLSSEPCVQSSIFGFVMT